MTTNPSEVVDAGVSISDATAALAQFEEADAPAIDEQPVDGGEAVELEGEEIEAQEEGEVEEIEEIEDGDPDDPYHTIKLDGEEHDVALSELKNGYQRQADYTRKTQEIAAERREIEQGKQGVQQQAVAYAQAYLNTADQFAALAPSEQDIKDAWAYDPKGAAELKERRERIINQASQVRNMAVGIHQQQQGLLKQQMAHAGQELPKHIPEWTDLDVRKTEIVSIGQYLVGQGMQPRDIEQTANPVAWSIARKAWMYDQLQKKTGAKVEKTAAPKIRKTRAHKPRLKGGRRQAATNMAQFNQSPTKDNAVALMAQFEE